MNVRRLLQTQLAKHVASLWREPEAHQVPIEIQESVNFRWGDYATNLAMRLAPIVKDNSLRIAEKLAARFSKSGLVRADAAAPGFLNFTLTDQTLKRVSAAVMKAGRHFGESDLGKGRRVHVEFISANPTGPLHMGNGRGAFTGDVLSNVLAATGHRVWREYYFNDQGKQVQTLSESVIRKYFIQHGIVMDYPETCYQGTYVDELAAGLKLDGVKIGDMERLRVRIQSRVLGTMIRNIQRLVGKRLQIRFDRWFKESELYALKLDQQALRVLQAQGNLYESEGATWMKTTAFGDDKDRVLVKSDATKTYFLGDVAYTHDKLNRRKFDRAVVLLGADHHGYVGRLKAIAAALGHPGAYDVLIYQLVRLIKGGVEVRMSKRAGNFVTLDELVDEVGPDVARFFFLMHGADTHMDFDLDLAKERSEKNPVFYVQYAHARIASLNRKVAALMKKRGTKTTKGSLGDPEKKLLKVLLRFPEVVEDAASQYAVQKLPFYAMKLGQAFHEYYDSARVIDADVVNQYRFGVIQATQQVLQNCLRLMGVSAPDRM